MFQGYVSGLVGKGPEGVREDLREDLREGLREDLHTFLQHHSDARLRMCLHGSFICISTQSVRKL